MNATDGGLTMRGSDSKWLGATEKDFPEGKV